MIRRGQARMAQRLFRYGSCVPAEILGTTSVGELRADPLAKFRIKAAPATTVAESCAIRKAPGSLEEYKAFGTERNAPSFPR